MNGSSNSFMLLFPCMIIVTYVPIRFVSFLRYSKKLSRVYAYFILFEGNAQHPRSKHTVTAVCNPDRIERNSH